MIERPILFKAEMIRAILAGAKTQTRRLIDMDRLRAVVPHPIASDIIDGLHPALARRLLCSTEAGRFSVGMNPQGAVFKLGEDGKKFGLKPGEFNFVCPYADGRTWITPKTTHRDSPWTITPDGSQRLWVRETHAQFAVGNRTGTSPQCVAYRATCDVDGGLDYVNNGDEIMRLKITKWTPAIFMPRWASRITLEVTDVRVQRLQEITEDDAQAEGARHWPDIPDPHPFKQGERWSFGAPKSTDECFGTARFAFANLWDSINCRRRVREPVPLGSPGYGRMRSVIDENQPTWESNPFVWAITFRRVP